MTPVSHRKFVKTENVVVVDFLNNVYEEAIEK